MQRIFDNAGAAPINRAQGSDAAGAVALIEDSRGMLSDRMTRRSILWPTELLPKPLRITLRRNLFARHELGKARRAPLLVIAHPKTGNTWLRTMLTRFYLQKSGLPSDFTLKSDELHRLEPAIPRFFFSNGYYSYERVVAEALAGPRPDPALREKPVLLIARHPCDLAVSWYFQFTRRISAGKRELIQAELPEPIEVAGLEMWDFVMNREIGLANMIRFLNGWHERLAQIPNGHRTSYEAMRADPGRVLSQVLDLLGEPHDAANVRDAVEFGAFENLQKLEDERRFRHGGMQKNAKGDPDARKVRRGKVGGYRDYFTAEQVAEMDALVAAELDPAFGYGTAGLQKLARN